MAYIVARSDRKTLIFSGLFSVKEANWIKKAMIQVRVLEVSRNTKGCPMLPEKQTKTNIGVGMGVFLQLAGLYLYLIKAGNTAAILGIVLIVASIPVFVWGCMNYAEGKGHSKWVGLVGSTGLPGLLVLILLPDRDRHGPLARLQRRKLVGLAILVVGFALSLLGVWLNHVADNVRLERLLGPWIVVSIVLGICLTIGSLVLMVGDRRR